mmetsp:Transcript_580/g.1152  ORF Transcript_580/g.1152 Transcript_580/m.1152 type:complete len:95 (-) Transcript_580:351-635(-)
MERVQILRSAPKDLASREPLMMATAESVRKVRDVSKRLQVAIHERRITHEEIDLAMSKLDDLILQILPGCEPTTMQRGPGTRAMPLTKSNDANQ